MGYTNYRYDAAYSVLQRALDGVAASDPSVNVGILTEPVWANSSSNEAGSDTSADFEMMYDACADVRKYISDGMFDFVAVKAGGSLTDPSIPFIKVMSWWSELADSAGVHLRSIQMYEQKKKDINKAGAQTLYKISKVLGCTIEDLLEK